MKSPASIVNTLLESDDRADYDPNLDPFLKILLEPFYVDYDPSLDPFSDPKNITHDDLGTAYLSKEDVRGSEYNIRVWPKMLWGLGLIDSDYINTSMLTPREQHMVDTVDRIYIKQATWRTPDSTNLPASPLRDAAVKRLTAELGPPDKRFNCWFIHVLPLPTDE